MLAVNYSTYRSRLKEFCDRVINDSETVIVTRKNEENVVMMSLEEYNNIMENLKVLKDPNYFSELFESLEQIKKKNIVLKSMEELEAMER